MSLLRLNIPSIDDELRGIPSGSVIALEGSSLSYANLVARVILSSRSTLGERVTYFAVDEDFDDVRDSMTSLGLRIHAFEASGVWSFIGEPDKPLREHFMTLLGRIKDGDWTCIDTFSSLVNNVCKDEEDLINMLNDLKRASKAGGGLHLLIIIPVMHIPKQLSIIRNKVDVIIKVSYKEAGNSYVRYLKVVKSKRRPHQGIIVPFSITRTGIVFETITRIA
ncbi:MAG: RAD55 family ATPase [Candidatus Nezhaarchaeales archaeon]